jgi:hypothetical protein
MKEFLEEILSLGVEVAVVETVKVAVGLLTSDLPL